MKFFVRYSPHQDEVETFLLKQKIIVYIIIYKKKVTSLCDPILRCVNTYCLPGNFGKDLIILIKQELSLNSGFLKIKTLLTARQRFAMLSISDKHEGPGWI